jgi:putative heme transporter
MATELVDRAEPGADGSASPGDPATVEGAPEPERTRPFRWPRLLAIAAAVVGLAVLGLRGRLPGPRDFVIALGDARYGWIVLAALLQAASLAAFAFQQRRLLDNLGVRLRHGHAVAITLARTALAISLPAGAAVSTGYAIREYQRAGASREVGAASAIVSGLASIGGLTLLYVGGALTVVTRNPAAFLSWRPLVVVLGLAAVTAAAVVVGRRQMHGSVAAEPGRASRSDSRVLRYLRNLLASARDAWRAGAALRTRDWVVALTYAAVNWLTDLLCLAAATRALGLPVGVTTLAGIYLGVQIVRQVPLTPGGVGVIETALVAGLTASGATAISAAAAVLIYRLLSCWLIIPAGGIAALVLRRDPDPTLVLQRHPGPR